ncbi:MAG: hypothetical protein ACE5GE_17575, partial [Phycisphaerae bacterium]
AISKWAPGQPHTLFVQADAVDLTPIQALQPPLYVMSLVNLDGDADADEAVAIHGNPNVAPGFVAETFNGVGGPLCVSVSTTALPVAFEPDGYQYIDLNLNGALDVVTLDFFTGQQLRLFNDGLGNFSAAFAGDADGNQVINLGDYRIQNQLGCLNGPGTAPGNLPQDRLTCVNVFDFNADQDVDLQDQAELIRHLGP